MSIRFRRRIKVLPGIYINVGKTGFSTSFGKRGANINIGKRGVYMNTGIPGSGVSVREKIGGRLDVNGELPKSFSFSIVFRYLISLIIFIAALSILSTRFWQAFFLILIAFPIIPPGQCFIEEKSKYQFSRFIKILYYSLMVIIVYNIAEYYEKFEILEKEKIVEIENKKKAEEEKIRKDSLDFYFTQSEINFNSKRIPEAIENISKALLLATDEKAEILSKRAEYKINGKQIDGALSDYSEILLINKENPEILYARALCYIKLKKTQEAVNDLKIAIKLGSAESDKLHEKINPKKRRIAHYVVRCCDGSSSSHSGRGACSHHGGICNPSEPVYEEYRKY
jgi:tetratricopeptide (TPR) repeat protein